jgi:hypothetical protein
MGSKAFILLANIVLLIISSEVAARKDLAQTSSNQKNGALGSIYFALVPLFRATNFNACSFRFFLMNNAVFVLREHV